MAPKSPALEEEAPERYQGFSLGSVTWGYRDIFADAIESLFREGWLGPERREVTGKFFELLKRSDQSCFDHVLRQFLGALNPANRWIMDLPGIFGDLVDLGAALASSRLSYGTRFFEALAAGGVGRSPQQVRDCLNWLRRLRPVDEELAMAFLAGYARLSERLSPPELERYMAVALQMHRNRPESAYAFLRGELATSETYLRAIARECRLSDVAASLGALLHALSGAECEVGDLGGLDSDELLARGTRVLLVSGRLYLPASTRRFETAGANRRWYKLCAVLAAMLVKGSFPRIHGHPEYRTCAGLVGRDLRRVNLFVLFEYARVLRRARRRWPGLGRLLDGALRSDPSDTARMLADALDDASRTPGMAAMCRAADECVNCFASAERLDEPWAAELLAAYPELARRPLPPVGFLSDFLFPVAFSEAPTDRTVADLKDAARRRRGDPKEAEAATDDEGAGGRRPSDSEEVEASEAAYLYHEWDFRQNDYRPDWCRLRQKRTEPGGTPPPESWLGEADKVRAVFERLKPEVARREKRLSDGDDINVDLLLAHLVDRRREPSPPVRFYERPVINHRDLAVLILLDVSGSTGERAGGSGRVLDVEVRAAVALGQGLAALGDSFALCGFSSSGREQCEYLLFKDFGEPWSAESVRRMTGARPRSSTRIGPALRHSGWLLSRRPARQKLIILVTDGKPMDEGYDPSTRYAQHDVRMACEENARLDVHTFAISTDENSLADMEIMFPRRRFVILPDIGQLPRVLPQLYLRLTL